MKHKYHSVIGTLRILERMHNSVNGNPRYRVAIERLDRVDLVFVTKPDSSLAYKITNYADRLVTAEYREYYGKDTITDIYSCFVK